ncbi:MAG TPA: threonylcarbamoyl-AMP synthase [Synergistetes bacterium]|nr:threonylcarbamoyl-AMP synthase [Synergistota bacterium]
MTELIKVNPLDPEKEVMERAASVIRSGGLVVFPTETVYGLGANALDPTAAERIFSAKGRPADNPLIVHVHEPEGAELLGRLDQRTLDLMNIFWPGPLTLVIPAYPSVPLQVTGGLVTVAVRMPAHPVALELIRRSGVPIAGPSANRSGRPSPTRAEDVMEDLGGRVEMILDAGPTDIGVESTVLDVSGRVPILLRPGGTSLEMLEDVVGEVLVSSSNDDLVRSPGTRYRHYAPSIPVILLESGQTPRPGCTEALTMAYVGISTPAFSAIAEIRFATVESYAAGLFAALRELERSGAEAICAELPPGAGIGRAVRDRLKRAAGKASA